MEAELMPHHAQPRPAACVSRGQAAGDATLGFAGKQVGDPGTIWLLSTLRAVVGWCANTEWRRWLRVENAAFL
jgi:hypothetical protein